MSSSMSWCSFTIQSQTSKSATDLKRNFAQIVKILKETIKSVVKHQCNAKMMFTVRLHLHHTSATEHCTFPCVKCRASPIISRDCPTCEKYTKKVPDPFSKSSHPKPYMKTHMLADEWGCHCGGVINNGTTGPQIKGKAFPCLLGECMILHMFLTCTKCKPSLKCIFFL